jgi:hypothetical protein
MKSKFQEPSVTPLIYIHFPPLSLVAPLFFVFNNNSIYINPNSFRSPCFCSHTFNGIMFNVTVKNDLPMQSLMIESFSVRGALGPVTVWVTKQGSWENKHENKAEWDNVFQGTLPPSPSTLVELPLKTILLLSPGETRGIYIHSSLPGDEGIVYDNRKADTVHDDKFLTVESGIAHISSTVFGRVGMWGWGGAWRSNREFVGRIKYGARYLLWNPTPKIHGKFPKAFQDMVMTLLLCQRRNECVLSYLPMDVFFYLINMLKYDWANPPPTKKKSFLKRIGDGISGTERLLTSALNFHIPF